jgi:hypothetical protein
MWKYGFVVGELVGAGAAFKLFCVVYGGLERERGEGREARVRICRYVYGLDVARGEDGL